MNENGNIDKWLKFLDPENLKGNLIFSSLYIASFESFKDYVIREVKSFFTNGFANGEYLLDPKYTSHVLSKDKSQLKASLLWFMDMGAIDEEDLNIYNDIREYRNKLSHELMELLFEGLPEELPKKFNQLINLSIKIEKWWILNIEIPTNPDFDNIENINEEGIMTSSQMLYRLIMDMLSGDEKAANFYKNEFLKYFNK
ncbi:MAG: hypothetical protein H6540_04650 [Bacteroidales bacterium]|nr:hypothetical protein [Bacteroidales bacterium]